MNLQSSIGALMFKHLRSGHVLKGRAKPETRSKAASAAVFIDTKQAEIIYYDTNIIFTTEIVSGFPGKNRTSYFMDTPQSPRREISFDSEHNEHHWGNELMKKYFLKVANALKGSNYIVLFGPGLIKKHLHKYLESIVEIAPHLHAETITVGKIKETKKIALVREFLAPKSNEDRFSS